MASEVITLQGGPMAGARYDWEGGDTLEVPVSSQVMITGTHPKPDLPPEPSIYRRSLRNRSIFVYQP